VLPDWTDGDVEHVLFGDRSGLPFGRFDYHLVALSGRLALNLPAVAQIDNVRTGGDRENGNEKKRNNLHGTGTPGESF